MGASWSCQHPSAAALTAMHRAVQFGNADATLPQPPPSWCSVGPQSAARTLGEAGVDDYRIRRPRGLLLHPIQRRAVGSVQRGASPSQPVAGDGRQPGGCERRGPARLLWQLQQRAAAGPRCHSVRVAWDTQMIGQHCSRCVGSLTAGLGSGSRRARGRRSASAAAG